MAVTMGITYLILLVLQTMLLNNEDKKEIDLEKVIIRAKVPF